MKARRRKRAMDSLESVVSCEGGAGMVEGARTRERYTTHCVESAARSRQILIYLHFVCESTNTAVVIGGDNP